MSTRRMSLVVGASLVLGLAGCSTTMVKSDRPIKPSATEATVVFMRATMFGGAITAALYDVSGTEPKFIGLIDHGSKVAYSVPPGEHTFMVVSEAADFMRATVSAGKTYYALVTPRPGAWRARFSFKPLRQSDLDGPDFPKWDGATQLVDNSAASRGWAEKNAGSVASKRASYWAEWIAKPAAQQESQTLHEVDGR